MAEIEFTSAQFFKALSEHKLIGARARAAGAIVCPPRPSLPGTSAGESELVELSGEGTLATFTIIYIAPSAMIAAGYDRKNPYCAGIVTLKEGPKVSAQIIGVDAHHPEQIKIGMTVRAGFVERGEGDAKKTYLVFEPA